MKLIWTDRAVQDIELIADYISQDSEEASARWVRRIIEKIEEIPLFPRSGRIVPEYNLETVREKIYGNYRIIYDSVDLVRFQKV